MQQRMLKNVCRYVFKLIKEEVDAMDIQTILSTMIKFWPLKESWPCKTQGFVIFSGQQRSRRRG